jgi:hypothetical protein
MNFFKELRTAAREVAVQFGDSLDLTVDIASLQFVEWPGAFRGLYLFRAVTLSGEWRQVSVTQELANSGKRLRLSAPGIVRVVNLGDFRDRVVALVRAREKSQGQVISDACFDNYFRKTGTAADHAEAALRAEHDAEVATTGAELRAAEARAEESWARSMGLPPFPFQTE